MVKASVPVFKDLRLAVNRDGKNNDLTDAVGHLPAAQNAAARASGPTVQAMIDSEPTFTFLRPYVPDLLNTVGKLGQISANYDANGHFVRVQPAGLGIFTDNAGTLDPIAIADQFQDYGPFNGTPTSSSSAAAPAARPSPPSTAPARSSTAAGSPPRSHRSTNDCTVTDVPPGP